VLKRKPSHEQINGEMFNEEDIDFLATAIHEVAAKITAEGNRTSQP